MVGGRWKRREGRGETGTSHIRHLVLVIAKGEDNQVMVTMIVKLIELIMF